MLRYVLPIATVFGVLASPSLAAPFIYDARWFAGVRDNVLTIQERQRARIEAVERRRQAEEKDKREPRVAAQTADAERAANGR